MTPSTTVTAHGSSAADVLTEAAYAAGVDATGATLIRDGANVLYQLPGDRVARVGRPGTQATAERELAVARWLATEGVPVARPLVGVPQPIVVNDRPVTWWERIPEHRHGTTAQLGSLLCTLHALAPSRAPELAPYDPFADIAQRITGATRLEDDDRDWLSHRLTQLREAFEGFRSTVAERVIHGDAWQGNVAVPTTGEPLLLDLEHVSLGDPDWDLIPIAVDYTDFARLSTSDYRAFVEAYGGRDVTATAKFRMFADVQELRWVCFVLGKAARDDAAMGETRHRIACLRGEVLRPWSWTAF